MAAIGKIIIPVSSELKTKYDLPENTGLFDKDEDWLILWVQPGDYSIVNTFTAGEINRGFSTTTVLLKEQIYTCEITLKDQRMALYKILKELIADAIADPTVYKLIEIHDYCYLDTDFDETQGYTLRRGILQVESQGFNFVGSTRYTQGLRIIFDQVN